MTRERQQGISIAADFGLTHTIGAIRNGKCYRDIFQIAVAEAGTEKLIEILKMAKNPDWAYLCACNVGSLTKKQKSALIDIVIEAKDPESAFWCAWGISGLARKQKSALIDIVIEAKDPKWARICARYVGGITEQQMSALAEIG